MDSMSSSHIQGLSVEVQQVILSYIPDVLSLRSAALSCRALYKALLGAETIITTRVLLNQVGFHVFTEANLAQVALRSKLDSVESIQDFIVKHLHIRHPSPESWTLREAVPIAKFHTCVREMASKFIAAAAKKSPVWRIKPATRTEMSRIERTMYQFETFCSLFRGSKKFDFSVLCQLWSSFFSNLAPWEIEQLACVHDFLIEEVYPAFNDVAEHDVAWGEFRVKYCDRKHSIFIQYLLSLGLEALRQISVAKTYDARHDCLHSSYYPNHRSNFLCDALNNANGVNDGIYLIGLNNAIDEHIHIGPPFFDDPDTGPATIWRRAHLYNTRANFVNQESQETLREWGYVMCDRSRVDDSGLLELPWEPLDLDAIESLADFQRHAAADASWEADLMTRELGRLSWGDPNDHGEGSRPSRKTPYSSGLAPTHTVPMSLEAAKDEFRLMKLPASVAKLNIRK